MSSFSMYRIRFTEDIVDSIVESFEQVVLALEVAAQFGTEVDSCHWWELPQVSLLS